MQRAEKSPPHAADAPAIKTFFSEIATVTFIYKKGFWCQHLPVLSSPSRDYFFWKLHNKEENGLPPSP